MVIRLPIEATFMNIAKEVAKRGTCKRAKVGCIIVFDKRIVSMGYNGSPSGLAHCDETGCKIYKNNCIRATHAELNAIAFAAKSGISTKESTLYTTSAPCFNCAHAIIAAGITNIIYKKSYHDSGIDMLKKAGIWVVKWKS